MSTIKKEINKLLTLEKKVTTIQQEKHISIDDYHREMLIGEILNVIDICNLKDVYVTVDEISRIETGLRNVLLRGY